MTHDEHHGNGPKQSAPTPGNDRQGNGADDNNTRQRARRQIRHIRTVGQEHTRPGHNHRITGGCGHGRPRQPRRQPQQPRQRRLHQPRQFAQHRSDDPGRRANHRRHRGHNRQRQRRQPHGQQPQPANRRANQATEERRLAVNHRFPPQSPRSGV